MLNPTLGTVVMIGWFPVPIRYFCLCLEVWTVSNRVPVLCRLPLDHKLSQYSDWSVVSLRLYSDLNRKWSAGESWITTRQCTLGGLFFDYRSDPEAACENVNGLYNVFTTERVHVLNGNRVDYLYCVIQSPTSQLHWFIKLFNLFVDQLCLY